MADEAVQMQQIDEALVEQSARLPSSYAGWVLDKAWALLAGSRSRQDPRSDGLEALDMLGGWKGADVGRRDVG